MRASGDSFRGSMIANSTVFPTLKIRMDHSATSDNASGQPHVNCRSDVHNLHRLRVPAFRSAQRSAIIHHKCFPKEVIRISFLPRFLLNEPQALS
jgi:hypothetical protein